MPETCPKCKTRHRLVRSGFYRRTVIDEEGAKFLLAIQRVRCRSCNGSHSLLFDFLVPYRRPTFAALKAVVETYLTTQTTYLDAVGESVGEPGTVFSLVEQVLGRLNQLWMCLMQILIPSGFKPAVIQATVTCPNGSRSRKKGKNALLDWAAAILDLAPNAFELCNRRKERLCVVKGAQLRMQALLGIFRLRV